jgi:hypothetical protein
MHYTIPQLKLSKSGKKILDKKHFQYCIKPYRPTKKLKKILSKTLFELGKHQNNKRNRIINWLINFLLMKGFYSLSNAAISCFFFF